MINRSREDFEEEVGAAQSLLEMLAEYREHNRLAPVDDQLLLDEAIDQAREHFEALVREYGPMYTIMSSDSEDSDSDVDMNAFVKPIYNDPSVDLVSAAAESAMWYEEFASV